MRTLLDISSEPKLWMCTKLLYVLFLLLVGCIGSDSPRGAADDSPQVNAVQEGGNPLQNIVTDQGNASLPGVVSPHRNFE